MKSLLFALALTAMGSEAAYACSPIVGYRIPTNIELLESADLVVLARVGQGQQTCEKSGGRQQCWGTASLSTIRILKGEVRSDLLVDATFTDRRGEAYSPEPTPLNESHSSAWWGACIRQAYVKDTLVLAMFREHDGEMRQMGEPFARAVEDVEGQDGLWVRAADLYLRLLSQAPGDARIDAFEAERDRLRALADDTDAQAIAADIDAYLAAIQAGDNKSS